MYGFEVVRYLDIAIKREYIDSKWLSKNFQEETF